MAIFLYIDTANGGGTRTLDGISRQTLDAIPAGQLLEVRPSDATGRFSVVVRNERPAASTDLAKQLVTTISTLVVAISSFYFGSQSVESARRTRPDTRTSTPVAPTPVPPTPVPPTPA
jgi:hypothetical protein